MVLGIIPDGNRRWAKHNGRSDDEGHTAGMANLHSITKALLPRVEHLYLYLLAWHNWERPVEELSWLAKVEAPIIQEYINNPKVTIQHGHPQRKIGASIDVVVRSMPGASELSGFFPEESKNARLVVLDKYWPDVTIEDFYGILAAR